MKAKTVHVIDYGVGNIFNIIYALKSVGAKVIHCTTADQLKDANSIVLPGVGAFGDCIKKIEEADFKFPILEKIAQGKPLLGICVGMQLLGSLGEEHGIHPGLNIIPGKVKKISTQIQERKSVRVPNVGWRRVYSLDNNPQSWNNSIFKNIEPGAFLYFVHSFALYCENPNQHLLAYCNYENYHIPSSVTAGNVFGVQFHPEKSGKTGLKILENFLNL